MRNLRILMGLSFSVAIVALMTVSARPAVEMVQTPTPDELAELQRRSIQWWQNYKVRMSNQVEELVLVNL